jgi:hypothetical protein
VLAAASANIAFNCDLVNSSGCLTAGLRVETILSTGRAQAANSAGFRFGTGVCTDNLNAGVAVMKSAQDGA